MSTEFPSPVPLTPLESNTRFPMTWRRGAEERHAMTGGRITCSRSDVSGGRVSCMVTTRNALTGERRFRHVHFAAVHRTTIIESHSTITSRIYSTPPLPTGSISPLRDPQRALFIDALFLSSILEASVVAQDRYKTAYPHQSPLFQQ